MSGRAASARASTQQSRPTCLEQDSLLLLDARDLALCGIGSDLRVSTQQWRLLVAANPSRGPRNALGRPLAECSLLIALELARAAPRPHAPAAAFCRVKLSQRRSKSIAAAAAAKTNSLLVAAGGLRAGERDEPAARRGAAPLLLLLADEWCE